MVLPRINRLSDAFMKEVGVAQRVLRDPAGPFARLPSTRAALLRTITRMQSEGSITGDFKVSRQAQIQANVGLPQKAQALLDALRTVDHNLAQAAAAQARAAAAAKARAAAAAKAQAEAAAKAQAEAAAKARAAAAAKAQAAAAAKAQAEAAAAKARAEAAAKARAEAAGTRPVPGPPGGPPAPVLVGGGALALGVLLALLR